MKNRTIIGIVCMILAVAMTFAVAPLVNRLTSDTTTVSYTHLRAHETKANRGWRRRGEN